MSESQTTVCPRCSGRGWYFYDENHTKPCEVCCPHGKGWWQLPDEGYGARAGMWCCKEGCGEVRENRPLAVITVMESALVPLGRQVLIRAGKAFYVGAIGDPIEDAEFDCVALSPADYARFKESTS